MSKFKVTIARTLTQRLTIEVEAPNDLQATNIAEDKAGDLDFNNGTSSDSDYTVEDVTEITTPAC